MYTLLTKIAHSQGIKDMIKVAAGAQRVLTSHRPEPSCTLKDYANIKTPEENPSEPQIIIKTQSRPQVKQTAKSAQTHTPQPINVKAEEVIKPREDQSLSKQAVHEQSYYSEDNYIQDWEGDISSLERQQSKVVSGRFGRFYQYGKLGSQLLSIQTKAYLSRTFGSGNVQQIYQQGADRITEQLCKMRGAPLKVAQLLSIQEDGLVPAPIRQAFQKARQKAHIMPSGQVKKVLKKQLGSNWEELFEDFEIRPFAAASIGQVHLGTSKQGHDLAVKIQYPGVERSIRSDISNISMLLKLPGVLPKGIFLEKLLANTENQLRSECDYTREAKMQQLYDRCLKSVMGSEYERFKVPRINAKLSTRHILSSQLLKGIQVSNLQTQQSPQWLRDEVGRLVLKLTFSEIFQMGIMQSDPNPSNFTYDFNKKRLNLFDFGATHIYPESFLQHYRQIINGSTKEDREQILRESVHAGFLTEEENEVMLEQHYQSVLMLGQPLRHQGIYDFGSQRITQRIYKTIPLMLKNRLKAPPHEIYSLHRKLSGAYLACIRMRARVNCNQIYLDLKQGNRVQELI